MLPILLLVAVGGCLAGHVIAIVAGTILGLRFEWRSSHPRAMRWIRDDYHG